MLSNIKHLPTTLMGLLALLATLPQIGFVQQIMAISPKVAAYVTGISTVAAGLVLILGVGKANVK